MLHVARIHLQVYFEPLPPGEEVSLEYIFRPDPILSPREFTVAVHLFYEDPEGNFYSNTVFNSTVDIVEMPKLVDTEMVFMYLTLAALFGIAGKCELQCLYKSTATVCTFVQWHGLQVNNCTSSRLAKLLTTACCSVLTTLQPLLMAACVHTAAEQLCSAVCKDCPLLQATSHTPHWQRRLA